MSQAIEKAVAAHYEADSIEERIVGALRAAGKDPERLTTADLSTVDEFHIGGRAATAEVAAAMDLTPGMTLLDVGCGIGGPARYFAEERRVLATGIDLTPSFIDAAVRLTKRVGLEGRVQFRCGSALEMPFEDAVFDAATLFHVGMNIADKGQLFREVRRVVKPGGVFAIFDLMRTGTGELAFPVPWAMEPSVSFVEGPERYRALLESAGFQVVKERNRREFAIEFFAAMRARMESGVVDPVGLPVLMGPTAPLKLGNAIGAIHGGVIAPIEMICR